MVVDFDEFYRTTLPRMAVTWWDGDILVERTGDDVITIQLEEPARTNNIGASSASFRIRVQLLGTAFSDPSVRRVEDITIVGFVSLCGFHEGGPDCFDRTRQEFFTELQDH